jgi:hypothetical protein
VGRRDVDGELLDQPRQPGRLPSGQVEDQPRQGRGVDDRVLERALEAAADEPGVESVVTVLDQHRALGEAEERASGVLELRRADEHRAVDVVTLASEGVDWRPAVDEGVEERERAVQAKPLGADLEHEERRVACGLDVQGDELGVVKRRRAADLGRIDGDLLVGDEGRGAARLQEQRLGAFSFLTHRASASARRAHAISSNVTARRSSTATL